MSKLHINPGGYKSDFLYFSLGFFIFSGFSLCTISFVNHSLEPEELGRYSYIKSVFELLVSVLSLNIYSAYLRFNINGSNTSLIKIVQRYIVIVTIFLFVLFAIISESILSAFFAFILILNERNYYFRSLMQTKLLNISRIIPAAITLFSIITIVYIFRIDLTGEYVFLSYGMGYIFVLFLYRFKVNSKHDDSVIKLTVILKYCLPLGLLVIVDWLLNVSAQIVIKQTVGYVELASFAIAQRALLSVKLFTGLFLMFYPTLYYREIEKGNKNLINRSRLLIMCILALVTISVMLLSKYVYIVMGASNYIANIRIFHILLIAEFLRVLASFYALFLSYSLKILLNVVILAIGAILNLILLLLFVKDYGIEFAAFSSLVSFFLIFFLMIIFSYIPEQKFKQI